MLSLGKDEGSRVKLHQRYLDVITCRNSRCMDKKYSSSEAKFPEKCVTSSSVTSAGTKERQNVMMASVRATDGLGCPTAMSTNSTHLMVKRRNNNKI